MSTNLTQLLSTGFASLILAASAVAAPDCDTVAKKVSTDVAAKPERVLVIVEDAIVQSESCSCEIIKAAIAASKAPTKLVGQIVFTAVTVSNGMAATIAECAVAVAPDAASEIKAAVQKALEDAPKVEAVATNTSHEQSRASDGKNPISYDNYGKDPIGKNPLDKNPVVGREATPEDDADFGGPAARIGGVYLIHPSGGRVSEKEVIKKIVIVKTKEIKKKVLVTPGESSSIAEP
jgi:hypothetical protein